MRVGLGKEILPTGKPSFSASIIVAARNEAEDVPHLLEALQEQTYPKEQLEIIIADDGSTDATWEILNSYAGGMSNLRPIQIERVPPGWTPKKWALNTAIGHSTGEIILATDADCVPGPRWVETILRPFADPSVGLVCGPAPLEAMASSRWNEILLLESCAMDALGAAGSGRGLALICLGRNLACRKSVFEEVKGYEGLQHIVSGDDDLLMHKIACTGKWKIKFLPDRGALVSSPPPPDMKSFIQQRIRFGSAGRHYFTQKTPLWFRAIVLFMFAANLGGTGSLAALFSTQDPAWLGLLGLKIAAEGLLVFPYLRRIQKRIRISTFLVAAIFYPLYVTFFGIVGSFYPIIWKGRKYEGAQ